MPDSSARLRSPVEFQVELLVESSDLFSYLVIILLFGQLIHILDSLKNGHVNMVLSMDYLKVQVHCILYLM